MSSLTPDLWNTVYSFPLISYIISFLKDLIIAVMKTGPVPKHIALIMDGNRTFARKNGLPLAEGHSAGAESLIHVLDVSFRLGIQHVTIYAFSIENFNRSKEEVDTLFDLLRERLTYLSEKESSYARLNKIRIRIIGNKSMIPKDILEDLERIEQNTNVPQNTKCLNVCFPYTSRDDIVHSIRCVAQTQSTEVTVDDLNAHMYFGPDTPPLELLIRTSGQTRLSDFMLWQCNYKCTIEFVDTLWPDFKFLDITLLLLKWSYYKTMEIEQEAHRASTTKEDQLEIRNILEELPPHPPYKSVNER